MKANHWLALFILDTILHLPQSLVRVSRNNLIGLVIARVDFFENQRREITVRTSLRPAI